VLFLDEIRTAIYDMDAKLKKLYFITEQHDKSSVRVSNFLIYDKKLKSIAANI